MDQTTRCQPQLDSAGTKHWKDWPNAAAVSLPSPQSTSAYAYKPSSTIRPIIESRSRPGYKVFSLITLLVHCIEPAQMPGSWTGTMPIKARWQSVIGECIMNQYGSAVVHLCIGSMDLPLSTNSRFLGTGVVTAMRSTIAHTAR